MDGIQKFCSDIEKIRKHEKSVSEGAKNLLVRNFPNIKNLAQSFADYWDETYIKASPDQSKEPTKENVDKLVALYSLLDCDTEFTSCLTDDDWKNLCSLTNLEAEDMDLDILNNMMMIFVDKKAL